MTDKDLSELALKKRREYRKKWNAKNRDKCRKYEKRYWLKRALKELEDNANAEHSG